MRRVLLLAALSAGFCSGAFAQTKKPTTTTAKKDVVEIATASADHSTLVAAVKSAGLTETLKGKGPFTVFAPTNAAFEMMMQDEMSQSTMQENQDSMRNDNTSMEQDTTGGAYRSNSTYETTTQDTTPWNRERNMRDTSSTNWNQSRPMRDTTMNPRTTTRIYRDTIPNRTRTSRDTSGMGAAFPSGNTQQLTNVLNYHVVRGTYDSASLKQAIKAGNGKAQLTTLNGAKLTATLQGSAIYLEDVAGNRAKVTTADLRGSNGVVHVIDHVVMPNTDSNNQNRGK